jgi:hypothetical protein
MGVFQKNIMAKYMIHAVPKRMKYVTNYLIPSMLEQGISRSDIRIHNDEIHEGNLRACMHAFQEVDTSEDATWHLQDDVIISHDFKEKTEQHNYGIVCGFKSMYDGDTPSGIVPIKKMWFSFLCIRLPHNLTTGCAEWVLKYIIGNPVYKDWWSKGVNDDMLLRLYANEQYPREKVLNLDPNIVDHIDYLIGGTVNSSKRIVQIRSKLWTDEYLVEELERRLREDNYAV